MTKPGILSALGLTLLLGHAAHAGDLADVKTRGKLVMLTFPAVEDPFVAVDVEAMRAAGLKLADMRDPGSFHGVDVDLVKGFAQSLGVKLEIRPQTGGYGELLPALLAGQGDLVASRLTITPKRQEAADFSAPYFSQWAVAAVRPDSKLATLADLKGKRVAVMKGSSHFEFLSALSLNPEIRLTGYNMESYNAVLENQADYALMDSRAAVGEAVSAQFTDLKVGVRVHRSDQGVMVRKGSDLKAALDAYISGLRASGELEKVLARYGQGAAAAEK
ncbi:MAG TPA: transporter substrate-binding domain-containing protein [Vicinamibacteria bacterium]|nr:transporter substrate-binding domain-containing protein [Vicinamibacteria bacterium]